MRTTKTKQVSVKAQALKIVKGLPSGSSWDDVMYHIYVRQKIELGLADSKAGRVVSHSSIRKEFGLA